MHELSTISTVRSAPLISKGLIFFGNDDGAFYALESTGSRVVERWRFNASGQIRSFRPSGDGPLVYFGCEDGHVYGCRHEDGEQMYHYVSKGPVRAAPLWHNSKLYFGSDTFYAVDDS
ncbi:yxaL [Symbiodinium sp. KB8]|nr:yxaL [Symbiodinium sp. KB8]